MSIKMSISLCRILVLVVVSVCCLCQILLCIVFFNTFGSTIMNPIAALTIPRLPFRPQRHDFRLDKAGIARDMVHRKHHITFTCYDVYHAHVRRVDNLTLPELILRGGFYGTPARSQSLHLETWAMRWRQAYNSGIRCGHPRERRRASDENLTDRKSGSPVTTTVAGGETSALPLFC